LLASQRVQPEKLLSSGYKFRYESLQPALESILANQ
jgi:NAD dependent epimerase/dehydratase family enzyme